MREEDLEAKFKNPEDPLQLVFVCAMWITGFDVPTCSTVYIDKPMKNHTLMQTGDLRSSHTARTEIKQGRGAEREGRRPRAARPAC
jgi:hypothetical protein